MALRIASGAPSGAAFALFPTIPLAVNALAAVSTKAILRISFSYFGLPAVDETNAVRRGSFQSIQIQSAACA
jgi:hypothetical protein